LGGGGVYGVESPAGGRIPRAATPEPGDGRSARDAIDLRSITMSDAGQPAAHGEDAGLAPALRMQQMLSGFLVSQALYGVAELDVATALLDGPRAVAELAAVTGADADALRRVLRFLAQFDVFRIDEDVVTLTDLGRTLADGTPGSVRGLARYWMETHYAPFSGLAHTLRTGETGATHYLGQPFFDWVGCSPHLAELQNAAMAGAGRNARGAMLDDYRLPDGATVADIGGADGSLLCGLLAGEPHRRGIVFDLPAVVEGARETVRSAGLSDRVEVVGGSFFERVPAADVYLMSLVLHDWDDETAALILRGVAASARPGARLVLFEAVVPDGNWPHHSKLLDLVMLVMLGGRERSAGEWENLLASGGFALDRILSGAGQFSIIEATLK
jgi:O-methyltransferase domain